MMTLRKTTAASGIEEDEATSSTSGFLPAMISPVLKSKKKNRLSASTASTSSSTTTTTKKKKKIKSLSNPIVVVVDDEVQQQQQQQQSPEMSPKPKRHKKRSWRGEGAARKLSEALPAALRSPTQILRRKKPLGPSLSWDPEHRSRSPSMTRTSRVHSDGSSENLAEKKKTDCEYLSDDPIVEEPRFELEVSCVHCAMAADYRRRMLKTEIETAVMRLARRLGNNGRSGRDTPSSSDGGGLHHRHTISSHHHHHHRGTTPDIVVSSISSDEEDEIMVRHTSSEMGNSLQTSEASSAGSSTCTSPLFPRNGTVMTFDSPTGSDQLTPPSPHRLQAPQLLTPYPDSASPPRSNSVDLSTLRRDIELLSVSSGDSDCASDTNDFEPPTPAESVRTFRSKSHDPSAATENILRRPSRIEHLSELFRH